MQRIGWGTLAAALLGGCVDGTGAFCKVHGDCEAGLACVKSACEPCEGGGEGIACQAVDLVVRSCEPAADPLEGAKKLRITVSGDGIEPLVREFELAAKSARTPAIPFGAGRRVLVEALAEDGTPLARGRSLPFDVRRDTPVVAPVVWVRRIGSFSPTQPIDDAASCTRLVAARAGHTSTLLPDGRVVLAGGYAFDPSGAKIPVSSIEVYDPRRGTFHPLPAGLHEARAGHTATLLPDGRVLFAGGVAWKDGAAEPLATAELLDPQEATLTLLNMMQPRAHHAAALLPDGSVLLTGGVTGTVPATDSTELFTPAGGGAFKAGPRLQHARKDHAVVVHDGALLLVGGHDGTASLASVEEVGAGPSSRSDWHLSVPKAQPLAAPFRSGENDGLFVFGAPDAAPAPVEQLWDFFPWSATASLPARDPAAKAMARFDACAAPFPGGAIVVGGRDPDGVLLSTADVFTFGSAGITAAPAKRDISAPRANASCVTLGDGAILVSGGEGSTEGKAVVSFETEVYEP